MAFWVPFKVQFHFASPREVQAYVDGLWHAPPSRKLYRRKSLPTVLLVVVLVGASAWATLPVTALFGKGTVVLMAFLKARGPGAETGTGKKGAGAGTSTGAGTGTEAAADSAWRAAQLARLIRPGEVLVIQEEHDSWQERYGDGVYRSRLKPEAVRIALWQYLESNVKGQASAPGDFSRSLDADRIRAITRQAERSLPPRP